MGAIMQTETPKKPQPYNDFVSWTQTAVNDILNYNPNNK
jgi:hypothetical protein